MPPFSCTISSDGKVRLYDLAALPASAEEKTQLEPVAEYDTKGTRLTCLAVGDGDVAAPLANGKRKREADEDDEGDEDALGSHGDANSASEQEGEEAEEEEEEEEEGEGEYEDDED